MRYSMTLKIESERSDRLQKVAERMARKADEEGVSVEIGVQEGREMPKSDDATSRTFDAGATAV